MPEAEPAQAVSRLFYTGVSPSESSPMPVAAVSADTKRLPSPALRRFAWLMLPWIKPSFLQVLKLKVKKLLILCVQLATKRAPYTAQCLKLFGCVVWSLFAKVIPRFWSRLMWPLAALMFPVLVT